MLKTFTVDGDPRGKQRPRHTKQGIVYTPTETTQYEKRVALEYRRVGGELIDGPVKVEIWSFFRIPASKSKKAAAEMLGRPADKKPDIDNIEKIVLDGLQGVAFKDDKQVTETISHKIYWATARVVVSVDDMAAE